MTDLHEQITAAAADLERLIDTATRRLRRQTEGLEAGGHAVTPYDLIDSNGQPVLAPLLIARANLLAALAGLEAHR